MSRILDNSILLTIVLAHCDNLGLRLRTYLLYNNNNNTPTTKIIPNIIILNAWRLLFIYCSFLRYIIVHTHHNIFINLYSGNACDVRVGTPFAVATNRKRLLFPTIGTNIYYLRTCY